MRAQNRNVLFAGLLLLLGTGSASPQSFYSSKGIGLQRYFVSGPSVGMGGAGLAIVDNLTVNFMNPATLTALPITMISGNFLHEVADLNNGSLTASISNTNVAGAQFALPLRKNVAVLALGLMPFSSIEYGFISDERSSSEKSFVETLSGGGGVNSAFLSFSVQPVQRLAFGVTGLFHFGTIKNRWQVDFDSDAFNDTESEVASSFTAGNFRIGISYEVFSGWRIAGVLMPAVTLDANQSVTLERITRFSDLGETKLELPLAFGFGTAVDLSQHFLVALDYYRQRWSDVRKDGFVHDSERIAVGMEYSKRRNRNPSYLERMSIRAGLFYHDLGIEDPIGEKVTELFGTIGLGLPVKWTAGRVDLSLEIGRRGSMSHNPFQEDIIRISGSVTMGERWFVRGGRR